MEQTHRQRCVCIVQTIFWAPPYRAKHSAFDYCPIHSVHARIMCKPLAFRILRKLFCSHSDVVCKPFRCRQTIPRTSEDCSGSLQTKNGLNASKAMSSTTVIGCPQNGLKTYIENILTTMVRCYKNDFAAINLSNTKQAL